MDVLKELKKINPERSLDGFGFDLHEWSLAEWGNAVAGETGEMCNFIKKMHRGDLNHVRGRECVAEEMADIIIYLDLIATREGINLEQAIIDKFNKVSDRIGSSIKLIER